MVNVILGYLQNPKSLSFQVGTEHRGMLFGGERPRLKFNSKGPLSTSNSIFWVCLFQPNLEMKDDCALWNESLWPSQKISQRFYIIFLPFMDDISFPFFFFFSFFFFNFIDQKYMTGMRMRLCVLFIFIQLRAHFNGSSKI